ncbi:hypothetical protein [Streptomyces gobiensis]|uniref:hypothetical protein n=1 Tax=Streptomyces gobiensis TaxID=2875706 RepID=UPI001E444354|nr:hypothetical protein [Streptomyces gobiensis]UGY93384.1 hypothetical protein test1122_17800 [Streptomyces gobiensis]
MPKSSVMTADNTFLIPNGDLIDFTGTLKQPANAAPTDITTGAHNTTDNITAHTADNMPGTPGGTAPDTPTGPRVQSARPKRHRHRFTPATARHSSG